MPIELPTDTPDWIRLVEIDTSNGPVTVSVPDPLPVSVPDPLPIDGTVTADQGGAPWTIEGVVGGVAVPISGIPDPLPVSVPNPLPVSVPDPLPISGSVNIITETPNGPSMAIADDHGRLYTIPTVPNTATADHPPNEVGCTNAVSSSAQTLIAAPGAGNRIRLFAMSITTQSGSTGGAAAVSGTDSWGHLFGVRVEVGGYGRDWIDFPAQGMALAADTAVTVVIVGTIEYNAVVVWTVEVV